MVAANPLPPTAESGRALRAVPEPKKMSRVRATQLTTEDVRRACNEVTECIRILETDPPDGAELAELRVRLLRAHFYLTT